MNNSLFSELTMNDLQDQDDPVVNFENSLNNYRNVLEKMKQSQSINISQSEQFYNQKMQAKYKNESQFEQLQKSNDISYKLNEFSQLQETQNYDMKNSVQDRFKKFNQDSLNQNTQKQYIKFIQINNDETQLFFRKNFKSEIVFFDDLFQKFFEDKQYQLLFGENQEYLQNMEPILRNNICDNNLKINFEKLNNFIQNDNLLLAINQIFLQLKDQQNIKDQKIINQQIIEEISTLKSILNKKEKQLNNQEQKISQDQSKLQQSIKDGLKYLEKQYNSYIEKIESIFKQKQNQITKNYAGIERNFKQKLQLLEQKIKCSKDDQKKYKQKYEKIKNQKSIIEKNYEIQKHRADELDDRLKKEMINQEQIQQSIVELKQKEPQKVIQETHQNQYYEQLLQSLFSSDIQINFEKIVNIETIISKLIDTLPLISNSFDQMMQIKKKIPQIL